MRLTLEQRSSGLIDADYCLQIAHKMIDIFDQNEKNNQGFNSLEMLMIKSLYDDLFENMIKSRYEEGRRQVFELLTANENQIFIKDSKNNIIDFFNFFNKN